MHLRLLKLVQYRFLTVIRIPQQKHIYGLGKSALPILVEEGIAEEGILAHRIRMRELKELFLKHEMLIVDIHVMFTLAAQGRELKPVAWKEGRELHDTVTVDMVDGQRRLPVRPDAFFSLEDSRRSAGANRAHFFLEADRSTETQARFTEKIKAYWHYLQQGLHKEKHKIKSFRVLTITLTDARAENLCKLAASILPEGARKFFLFASLKQFSIENPAPLLDSVFRSPRAVGSDRYPLVPAPSQPTINTLAD